MFSQPPKVGPRHMAAARRAQGEAQPRHRAPAHLAGHGETELTEVPPVARVHRSRLAFAVSATLAALPILVLDNLPATADPSPEVRIESTAGAAAVERAPSTTSTLADPSTTTTAAAEPTSTEAPATSEATSTSAPATSEAPQVATLAAPAPTEAPTTAPPTTESPPPPPPTHGYDYGDPDDPATWDRLAQCESGGNWQANTGNGYYGGLQFSLATWRDVGGEGYPHEHTREEQIHRGQLLQARYGWGQWPHCASALGYR